MSTIEHSTPSKPAAALWPPALGAFVPRAADSSPILEPAPIHPPDVLEGEPVARSGAVADVGDGLSVWLWDCTAGRFTWSFGSCDEIVHIVSGAVEITDQEGTTFRLVEGDVAAFRANTRATWYVEDHVRKVAVIRETSRGVLSRGRRKLRRLLAAG